MNLKAFHNLYQIVVSLVRIMVSVKIRVSSVLVSCILAFVLPLQATLKYSTYSINTANTN